MLWLMPAGACRFHYGHPDVWRRSFVSTCGGVSKANKSLHVSEDVFGGYNVILRGRDIKYVDYIAVGKGRDMGFETINTFEAKVNCTRSVLDSARRLMSASSLEHTIQSSRCHVQIQSAAHGDMSCQVCDSCGLFCHCMQIAAGNGEQVLSRDVRRLAHNMDFTRLLSWYHTGEQ